MSGVRGNVYNIGPGIDNRSAPARFDKRRRECYRRRERFAGPERRPTKGRKIVTDIIRTHTGRRMSQIVSHGGTVYLAGQVAENAAGGTVGAQTRDILTSIDALLAEAGTDKTRILSAQVFLADIATFAEMNEAWDGWVAEGAAPARATIEAKLAAPEYTVEIMVVAAL